MRASLFILLGLLSGVAFCFPPFAHADDNGFSDGPYFAYPRGGDIGKSQGGVGWQVAYAWSDYLSTEFAATRQTDRFEDTGVLSPPFRSDLDLEMVSLALTARLGYPVGPFLFYAGGGLGYYYMRTDADKINQSIRDNPQALPRGLSDLNISADLKNTFGYHLALGADWVLTRRWAVFAEYRWVSLDSRLTYRRRESRPASGGPLAYDRVEIRSTEDFPYNHGLIRVGVNYRF